VNNRIGSLKILFLAISLFIFLIISFITYFIIINPAEHPKKKSDISEIIFKPYPCGAGKYPEYILIMKNYDQFAEIVLDSHLHNPKTIKFEFTSDQFAMISLWLNESGFFKLSEKYSLAPTDIEKCYIEISVVKKGIRKKLSLNYSECCLHPDFYEKLPHLWVTINTLYGIAEKEIRIAKLDDKKTSGNLNGKIIIKPGFPTASGYTKNNVWIVPDLQINKGYNFSDINDLILSIIEANISQNTWLIKEVTLYEAPASIIYALNDFNQYRVTSVVPIRITDIEAFLNEPLKDQITMYEVRVDFLRTGANRDVENLIFFIAERNQRLFYVKQYDDLVKNAYHYK